MPELATTILARLCRHDEVGLGTILGSDIFSGLLIVTVASLICPISVDRREVAAALVFGVLTVTRTFPTGSGFTERKRGVLLLVLYGLHLTLVLQRRAA